MNPERTPFVVAVIVAYHRDPELARLLHGLQSGVLPPSAAVVVDNAASSETRALVENILPGAIYLPEPSNPGPGRAWADGCRAAVDQWGDAITHFLTLDDDVALDGDILHLMVRGMREAGAGVAAPLLTDSDGKIWGVPEPREKKWRTVIRAVSTVRESRQALGNLPLDFCWATGACLLFTREAAEVTGWHRDDFFLLGEDLEWSMRATGGVRCVFFPDIAVPHLPPPPDPSLPPGSFELVKFCSLLQNLSYLAFHHPRGAHMMRYLPGNYRRFFRHYGAAPFFLVLALRTFWHGAALSRPAGHPSGARIRAAIFRRADADPRKPFP